MAAAPRLVYRWGSIERLVHSSFFLVYMSQMPSAHRKGLQTSFALTTTHYKELDLKRNHELLDD
eukprot:1784536-Amphidinium_carterae.2